MKNIFRTLILSFFFLSSGNSYAAQEKYILDKEHTEIIFTVDHLGFSKKIGSFKDFEGYFLFDEKKPENSYVKVTIKPAGIDSGSGKLNRELQKPDWFSTERFPVVTYESSSIDVLDKKTAQINGWLTMRGIKKRATMLVTFNKAGVNPADNSFVAGFSADTKVKRSLYGMKKYILFLGENVGIHIEVEGIKQK